VAGVFQKCDVGWGRNSTREVQVEGIGVHLPPDPDDALRLREPVLERLFSGMSSGMGLSVLFNVASAVRIASRRWHRSVMRSSMMG
jgi:hypothetical protein